MDISPKGDRGDEASEVPPKLTDIPSGAAKIAEAARPTPRVQDGTILDLTATRALLAGILQSEMDSQYQSSEALHELWKLNNKLPGIFDALHEKPRNGAVNLIHYDRHVTRISAGTLFDNLTKLEDLKLLLRPVARAEYVAPADVETEKK